MQKSEIRKPAVPSQYNSCFKGATCSAKVINGRIESVLDVISHEFYQYEVKEEMPYPSEIKQAVLIPICAVSEAKNNFFDLI